MKFLQTFAAIFLLINFSFSQVSLSDLKPGFDSQEALDMIQLCNSYTYIDLYGSDKEILPNGFKKKYTSPAVGLDNMFQVYQNGNIGIINFRGSTDKKESWLENMNSTIIPATGKIEFNGKTFNYSFANDTAAGVHTGYALGLAYLHENLISQIQKLNNTDIYNIIITGHSQGGSLALLTRAYFEHLTNKILSKKNEFKVYAFAHPMVGNIEFVNEYNTLFCATKMSYSLINPEDAVPNMPLSYNDSTFWKSQLTSFLSNNPEFDKNAMLKEGLTLLMQNKLQRSVDKFSASAMKQIENELGEVTLPETRKKINYAKIGNIIKLLPPEYPLELKDSSILENDAFLKENPRDKEGVFENKSVYKQTTISQNHKPYNYYTAILRAYFPKKYEVVDPKLFGL